MKKGTAVPTELFDISIQENNAKFKASKDLEAKNQKAIILGAD